MAIAFDANHSGSQVTATSLTWSHTCSTGSDRLLVVGVYSIGDVISGVTYNGQSMTHINTIAMTGTAIGWYLRLYYILNQSSGTNNVVVSASSSAALSGSSSSYTGVKQSSQPDASGGASLANSKSLTMSVTTTANNCWLIGWVRGDECNAGAGTTLRGGPQGNLQLMDSNGAKTPAGSYSLSVGQSWNVYISGSIASFAPAETANTSGFFQLFN